MKSSKNEYCKYLDYLRVFLCVAILLYHFNILKGGYLAVCSFFTLSGYLSCMSALKKEKFSVLSYYKNRFVKLYFPLLIVTFVTVLLVLVFVKDYVWINLKQEVISAILGYNNFWQLSANLDYFARHISSPFMHYWYISVLLQLELVFPLLFLILNKIGKKIKVLPVIITFIFGAISLVYFLYNTFNGSFMLGYYHTFARAFPLFFGMSLAFFTNNYKDLVFKKFLGNLKGKIVFGIYLVVLLFMFIMFRADSYFYSFGMVMTCFVSLRLIAYAKTFVSPDLNEKKSLLNYFAKISYEIYLFQYPIIFIFQYISLNVYLKYLAILSILIILSCLLNYITQKEVKFKILKVFLIIIFWLATCLGIYLYVNAKDYKEELKLLEQELNQNEMLMQKKQEEFNNNYEQEKLKFEELLKKYDDETSLKDMVRNLNIVGVGDSVMLGAIQTLYEKFPNSYYDAAISRTAWVLNDILKGLKSNNKLGNPIIINVGANGDCTLECKENIMKTLEGKEVFWLNVTNDKDVHVNERLKTFAESYENLHIIDWNGISSGHDEYFVADKIHLTSVGKIAYTEAIYNAIYEFYLNMFNEQKESAIKEYEEMLKNKVTFYGDTLLLNIYKTIEDKYKNDKFNVNKKYNYATLKNEILSSISTNTITNKIVLLFDNQIIHKDQYKELIELCHEQQLYIVSLNEDTTKYLENLHMPNATIIDFSSEINSNSNYLMIDNVHLSIAGNEALCDKISSVLK